MMPVQMTERAAQEFKNVCGNKALPIESTRLRIEGEENEQEGKLMIALRLENQEPRQEDLVKSTEGAQLVIDKNLDEALGNITLDYREERGGFVLERVQ